MLGALGALRQHREERQPRPEGGDGFGIGIPLCRIITGLLPILDGPPDLTAALEVESQPGGDLPRLCTIPCLQAHANAPVELHPPRRPYLLVQHLPVERMRKLIAPTAGAIRPLAQADVVKEMPLRRQLFTRHLDVLHRTLGPRRDRRYGKS